MKSFLNNIMNNISCIFFNIFSNISRIMGIRQSNLEEYQLPLEFKPILSQPSIYQSVLDHTKLTKYEVHIPNYANLNHQYSTSIFRKCNSQHIVGPKYFYPYDTGFCDSNYTICYFIEFIDCRLSDINQFNSLSEAFNALISILEGALILIRRYDYFLLTPKMVFFCSNKLKIWISENVTDSTIPQNLLSKGQNDMVKSIISIIDDRSSINKLYESRGLGQKIKKKIGYKKKCRIFEEFIGSQFKGNLQLHKVLSYLILYAEEFQMLSSQNPSQNRMTKKQKHRFHHSGDIYIKNKNQDRKFSIKKQISSAKTSCWMDKKQANFLNPKLGSLMENNLSKQTVKNISKQDQSTKKLGFRNNKNQKKLKKVNAKNLHNFRQNLHTVTDQLEESSRQYFNINITKIFNQQQQQKVPTSRLQPAIKRSDRNMPIYTVKASPRNSPKRKISYFDANTNLLFNQLHNPKQMTQNHNHQRQFAQNTKITINYNNRKSQDIYDRKTTNPHVSLAKRLSFQRNTINQQMIQNPISIHSFEQKRQTVNQKNNYSSVGQTLDDISQEKAYRQRIGSINTYSGALQNNLLNKTEKSELFSSKPMLMQIQKHKQNEQKQHIKRKSITKTQIQSTNLFSNNTILQKQNNIKKNHKNKRNQHRVSIESDILNFRNNSSGSGIQDQYVLLKSDEMKKLINNLKAQGTINSVANYLTTIKSIKMSEQQLCSYLDVQFMNSLHKK